MNFWLTIVGLMVLQGYCMFCCRSRISRPGTCHCRPHVAGGLCLYIRASPRMLREISITNSPSSTELSAGIVCSCMPICACLLHGHTPKNLHYLSPRHLYLSLRSRSSRRLLVSNRTYSLDNLQPQKHDSNSATLPKDYARLEDGSGLAETKNSVVTQRERLEY